MDSWQGRVMVEIGDVMLLNLFKPVFHLKSEV